MKHKVNFYDVELVRNTASGYTTVDTIRSPEDGARLLFDLYDVDSMTRENFLMVALDTKNKVIGSHTIHIGSLNSSIVSPREVFQPAILNNSAAIIVAHNHPSGDPKPSKEDIQVTKRLVKAGEILNVRLLDHLILGEKGEHISLKEKGYL